jgi:carboxyl-terminal processing protease
MFSHKKPIHIALIIVFFAGVFFVGALLGFHQRPIIERANALSNKTFLPEDIDFADFWKAWEILESKHVSSVDAPSIEDRMYGAIQGLADSYGDPYTTFFPPEESKIFHESVEGEFSGVGMELGIQDEILTIVSPLKDTPAYKADLQPGDAIVRIGEQSTSGMTIDMAVSLIRGERGTPVTLTIYREGEDVPFDVTLIRDTIKIPTLETKIIQDKIFVISIYTFTNQTPVSLRNALSEMKKLGLKKLVIDLRGNPGGFLDASIDMSSHFIPSGKPVVSEVFKDASREVIYRSKGYNSMNSEVDIVVLVDKGSASASEIFAGALQHYDVATLIGTETYGKGSVQELIPLTEDTSLKITIAKWVLPSGESLTEKGLTPDVLIPYEKNEDKTIDNQMNKAVEFLLK